MNETATHLRSTINTALPLLRSIPHATVRLDPYPPKWSKIQVLGHLVDSACNNHMKFTLAMAQPHTRVIGYAQNHWVDAQHYQDGDWNELVELWYAYNRHLAHVIARASPETLSHTLTIAGRRIRSCRRYPF